MTSIRLTHPCSTPPLLNFPPRSSGGSHRGQGGSGGGKGGGGSGGGCASDAESALTLPELGVLPDVAWAAVMAQQREVARFYQSLARERRREALLVPAQELDRSMAKSKDWDILVRTRGGQWGGQRADSGGTQLCRSLSDNLPA